MPTYKLTYFPVQALGEPIRMLFSYGKQEFIDDRFDRDDWETKIKPTTPFGQVPVLDVDGKKIAQSTAICRYLAKQYGLAGKNDWENLEIDATVDTIHDLRAKIAAYHYESNEDAKKEKKEAAKVSVPFYLERLDEQVKKNGGHFIGGRLTWADVVLAGLSDYLSNMHGSDILAGYKNLEALRTKVLNTAGIKEWVAKRPKTDM